MRHDQQPVLTQKAQDRLDELEQTIILDIFTQAQQLADRERVDTISARHIDDAYHAIIGSSRQASRWRAPAEVVGGAFIGVAGSVLYSQAQAGPPYHLALIFWPAAVIVLIIIAMAVGRR